MNTSEDPEALVGASFARQGVMRLLDARLLHAEPGLVRIGMPMRSEVTQQNGYVHAGVISTILDSACGYAGLTLMPPGSGVLTVEFKINLVRPATGDAFEAVGTVLRLGKRIAVSRGNAFAIRGTDRQLVAVMQATLIRTDQDREAP